MRRWNVRELACDPPGWHAEVQAWSDAYPGIVLEYATNKRTQMAPACNGFWTSVVEQTVSHDGDPRLAKHIAATVTKETPDGLLIVKEHPDSPRKIDLAVAAVIALDRAVNGVQEGPWVC